ncbi:MAG TPA: zf-HC2 domain-containing protein [Fimbriimonadaceae bacterium]|nr:zf-HC2 domain-containing protein [Fimbriimonadaceae bacterium]
MNCKNVQSLLSAYIDEELPGRAMLDIRRHLAECGECAEDLRCVEGVKRMLSATAVPEPSVGFEDRLVSRVLSEAPPPAQRRASFVTLSVVAAMSMIATLVVLGFLHRGEPSGSSGSHGIPYDVVRQDQAFDARWDGSAGGALYISAAHE